MTMVRGGRDGRRIEPVRGPTIEPSAARPDVREPRVLVVINRLTDVGGAEGSTTILVDGLQNNGVQFGVVTLHELGTSSQDSLEARGARFYTAGAGFRSQLRTTVRAIRDF